MKKLINIAASLALFQCVTFNLDAAHYNIDFNENTIRITNDSSENEMKFSNSEWTLNNTPLTGDNFKHLSETLNALKKEDIIPILIEIFKMQKSFFLGEIQTKINDILFYPLEPNNFLFTQSEIDNLKHLDNFINIKLIQHRLYLENEIIRIQKGIDNKKIDLFINQIPFLEIKINQLNSEINRSLNHSLLATDEEINKIKDINYCPEIFKNADYLYYLTYDSKQKKIILEFSIKNPTTHPVNEFDTFFETLLREQANPENRTVELSIIENPNFPVLNGINFQEVENNI